MTTLMDDFTKLGDLGRGVKASGEAVEEKESKVTAKGRETFKRVNRGLGTFTEWGLEGKTRQKITGTGSC